LTVGIKNTVAAIKEVIVYLILNPKFCGWVVVFHPPFKSFEYAEHCVVR